MGARIGTFLRTLTPAYILSSIIYRNWYQQWMRVCFPKAPVKVLKFLTVCRWIYNSISGIICIYFVASEVKMFLLVIFVLLENDYVVKSFFILFYSVWFFYYWFLITHYILRLLILNCHLRWTFSNPKVPLDFVNIYVYDMLILDFHISF